VRILGIYREEMFSPGKIKEDKKIMDDTLLELEKEGIETRSTFPEEVELAIVSFEPDVILNMAQSEEVLSVLKSCEDRGIRVINSTEAIRNCYRKNMIRILKESEIPMPKTWIYSIEQIEQEISEVYSLGWNGVYWIKRGDFHALEKNDVVQIRSFEQMESALSYFREKKVDQVIIQEHVEGTLIKFYGVGSSYIEAFLMPQAERCRLNGSEEEIVKSAADLLGLEIYGGDLVISEGKVFIIDMNDWPSFSLCKDAAFHISEYVKKICGGYR